MDKREATICGTLFWLMMTLFRFIVSGSSAKCSLKLRILTSSLLACSLLCLGLHWLGTSYLVTIMGSTVFGASCSAVFPLLISVSKEYRIKFKHEQVSRIMFMPFLSSFLLTGLTGEMIGWDVGLLFLCLVGMGGGLWVVGKKLLQVLEE